MAINQPIPFTQYLLPNGRRKKIVISRPEDIHDKAMAIMCGGYCFEIEILPNGLVYMAIADNEGDRDNEIVRNGPEVPTAVDKMITRFYERIIPELIEGGEEMIDKIFGEFHLVCDVCDEEANEVFDEFIDAVEGKKDLGWRSRKDPKKGWLDICPECQKKEG